MWYDYLAQAGFYFARKKTMPEQANGGFYKGDSRPADAPISTICQSGANQRLVNAYLVKYYDNEKDGISLTEPMHTLPTKDRTVTCVKMRWPLSSSIDQTFPR